MTYTYEDFLDFSLTKLNEIYPKGKTIRNLVSMYKQEKGIHIKNESQIHFIELYNYIHITQVGDSSTYRISAETKEIIDAYGNFSSYIKQNNISQLEKEKEEKELKKLQLKNLELQNENLEFSQTIREQEAKILDLEIKIKGIELIKQYWWFIGLCILIGGTLKEVLDLLI